MHSLVLAGLAAALLAVLLALTGGVSAGSDPCRRSVATGVAVDLQLALSDAPSASANICTAWDVDIAGTFVLTESLVYTSDLPLRIAGPSDGIARIEAANTPGNHRLLTVPPGSGEVSLARLILTGGNVSGLAAPDNEGGAIDAPAVILTDVELIGNRARNGGAVVTGDLTATRTSFIQNVAGPGSSADGLALGGAVLADGQVTLRNVSFIDNRAASGGALFLELSGAATGLDATFVTFLDNAAFDDDEGSDVQLDVVAGTGSPQVRLRGVLLWDVSDLAKGPSCAEVRGAGVAAPTRTVVDSFGIDASCGTGVSVLAAPPAEGRVPWLAAGLGLTDLWVPTGSWAGLDAVACDPSDGWPAEDQRGLARPQGVAARCDAGAVERAVNLSPPPPPPGSEGGPVVSGPVPTAIPAGEGPRGGPLRVSPPWRAGPARPR